MATVKMRQCISCKAERDGREMLRIVKTPDNEIRFDATGRASGRGAYLCKNQTCVKNAFQRKAFERALHMKVSGQEAEQLRTVLFEEMNIIEE
ncbi:MAG: YlxR family protein [Lachnospiraceae bacterium]|nr:YlxR family protein [Lachnospiraceae bacterium]